MMQDMAFAGSRYAFGGSYDELLDRDTGEAWVSEAGEPHRDAERYRDYAYLSTFAGPAGNAHLVIAGTRDTGLMQAAEIAADPGRLVQLGAQAPAPRGWEALYRGAGRQRHEHRVAADPGRRARIPAAVRVSRPSPVPPPAPADLGRLPGEFREVLRYMRKALGLVWLTSRSLTVWLAMLTVVVGALPALIAFIGARIVDAVVTAAMNGGPAGPVLVLVALGGPGRCAACAGDARAVAGTTLLRDQLGFRVNVLILAEGAHAGPASTSRIRSSTTA